MQPNYEVMGGGRGFGSLGASTYVLDLKGLVGTEILSVLILKDLMD